MAIRNNIVGKETTELDLLFHKNITKPVFLWLNIGHKSFKKLIKNKNPHEKLKEDKI